MTFRLIACGIMAVVPVACSGTQVWRGHGDSATPGPSPNVVNRMEADVPISLPANDMVTFPLPKSWCLMPRPEGSVVAGPLPRPVLLAQVTERNDTHADSSTSLLVHDPAIADSGMRRVYSSPGQDLYCRFLTPLLGGCGIAVGDLSENRSGRKMSWFNLLDGKVGATIASGTYRESLTPTGVRFLSSGQFSQYDVRDNSLVQYTMPLRGTRTLSDDTYLAWAEMPDGSDTVVRIDLATEVYTVIGTIPAEASVPDAWSRCEGAGVYPAGPDCRDGVYFLWNYSLFYMPPGEEWHEVVRDVHVFKTFGMRRATLQVAYLGEGRFAVARTVENRVKVPENEESRGFAFPKGRCVTMLIDGRTGEVLAETEPILYDHNPDLDIADEWWAPGERIRADQDPGTRERCFFAWSAEDETIRYGEGHSVSLTPGDKTALSGDGRYLLIYRERSEAGQLPTTIAFRIVDGKTGGDATYEVTSDYREIYVSTISWQVLCASTVDEAEWPKFRTSGFDYFFEPMSNW
jgi:hypothetical protein